MVSVCERGLSNACCAADVLVGQRWRVNNCTAPDGEFAAEASAFLARSYCLAVRCYVVLATHFRLLNMPSCQSLPAIKYLASGLSVGELQYSQASVMLCSIGVCMQHVACDLAYTAMHAFRKNKRSMPFVVQHFSPRQASDMK